MYETIAPYFDDVYPHDVFEAFMAPTVEALTSQLSLSTRKTKLLDLCCGTGRAINLFKGGDGIDAIGIDINPTLIDKAKINCPWANFHVRSVLDIGDIARPACFDLVLMMGVSILHFTEVERMAIFTTVARCLKPGGLFVFDVLHSEPPAPGSCEAILKKSVQMPDRVAIITYFRLYAEAVAYHFNCVTTTGRMPPFDVKTANDWFPFYPMGVRQALGEASAAGLCDGGTVPSNYPSSVFVAVGRGVGSSR